MTGEKLRVQTFGDPAGPPVLAVHGVYGHGGRWRDLASAQLADHRVDAPDLRGQGASSWAPPWTLEQHVADLLATMDALGLRRVGLLGFSFGAVVSLYLAREVPERVSRLVLLDPALGLAADAATASAERALSAPSFSDPTEARETYLKSWPNVAPTAADREIEDYLLRGEDGRWRWRYEPESIAAAYTQMARPAVLPPTEVPSLLVRATRSEVVSAEYLAACRASGVEVAEVDCGHQLLLDRPVETGVIVRGFLTA